MRFIDLRSDTVTKPSPAMREAMARAEVGDDVFGEDPTVNRFQEEVARLLGKEAALFVPSGVMANQIALKVHTRPGDEIIVERDAHIFHYETAAAAFLSNVQIHTVPGRRGILTVEDIRPALRPPVYYMPPTTLLCLENTHNRAGGTIYPLDTIKKLRRFTKAHSLTMHLDGARLWNACVATGIKPAVYASYFESVAVCFSKGLGAPVGSALAGTKSFIAQARRYRKIFGGGMRQAGIIAAGALYALNNNIERLKEDHEKARVFAAEIARLPGLSIDLETVQTNIVIIDVAKAKQSVHRALRRLRSHGILLTEAGPTSMRAVFHLDVSLDDVDRAIATFKKLYRP
jgi:threonine aldolase